MAAALKDMCDHIDENAVKVSALRDKLIAGLSKSRTASSTATRSTVCPAT